MGKRLPLVTAAADGEEAALPGSSASTRERSTPLLSSAQTVRNFEVRRPTPADAHSLAILWTEMQWHYGQPIDDATATAAATAACQFSKNKYSPILLVAVSKNTAIVACLVLNVTFPARELSKSLYIRDLYVSKDWRRFGVAQSLLQSAAALTISEGFSALDWTTDINNKGARILYEGLGAREINRVYFRLCGDDLRHAAFP